LRGKVGNERTTGIIMRVTLHERAANTY